MDHSAAGAPSAVEGAPSAPSSTPNHSPPAPSRVPPASSKTTATATPLKVPWPSTAQRLVKGAKTFVERRSGRVQPNNQQLDGDVNLVETFNTYEHLDGAWLLDPLTSRVIRFNEPAQISALIFTVTACVCCITDTNKGHNAPSFVYNALFFAWLLLRGRGR